MKTVKLGNSSLQVSNICLGTMTFGQQNTEAEAHAQLDYAFGQGINFIDAAEMYPVPTRAETTGRTEEYVGTWLKGQARDQVVVATKAAGPGRNQPWMRGGKLNFSRACLTEAVEGSLKRLQTDYIDLYQLHWPDRNAPIFGNTPFNPDLERETVPLRETLETLAELIKAGKVRHWGPSNETPWGLMSYLRLADELGLPRPVSVQNAYSLLNRTWEQGLSEIGFREQVSLLAYSPLGFGFLSGKYLADPNAQGRANLFKGFAGRYARPTVAKAVAAYVELARAHGLTPTQLALAFVYQRWCVGSTIIGATSMEQLKENLGAAEVKLSQEVLDAIGRIYQEYPDPAP